MSSGESIEFPELAVRYRMFRDSVVNPFLIDFNQTAMDEEYKKATVISWERKLTNEGVHPNDYEMVYDLAIKIYNETDFGKGPFNVNHLIQAAMRIREAGHRARTLPVSKVDTTKLALSPAPKCPSCNNTGLEWYTDSVGKRRLAHEIIDGKKKCKPCPLCKGGKSGEQKEDTKKAM